MTTFKCKMCGGALEISGGETVVTCEYCGAKQTLPKLDDDRRANMYDRANHFRRNNEFDKATGIYEQILNEDNSDSEAYWSLVLCRFGIEYVEDPVTHKRVPTVNRAQYTSVFDDDNYKSAFKNADAFQRAVYEEEANAINEIQKGILSISQKEEPFDVFICYKETDSSGRRTPDSVLANDLYHQLTQEGFKVFFSRITLEDKLGSAYEPYIFAALNSAKVMVVLGTKPEYFNAVWVKNEWARYLALIKNGAKKMLIPAYKDMDPYDLPEEFSHLQAQDMAKLGFMQDLIRGIKKIAQADEPKTTVVKETVVSGGNANTEPLLKRAFMFLEDGEWNSAKEYCEKVLDIDPECAEAYLGKLMAELKVTSRRNLKNCALPFDDRNNYNKAVRFGDEKLKEELKGYIDFIINRNLTDKYNKAVNAMQSAHTEEAYKKAAKIFKEIEEFKDSKELAEECLGKAEETRLLFLYNKALSAMNSAKTEGGYKEAAKLFEKITGFKDSKELAKECLEKAEEARKDFIIKAEEARKDSIIAEGKKKMIGTIVSNYEEAIKIFETVPGWRDSDEQIEACKKKIEELKAEKEVRNRIAALAAKKRKKIAITATAMSLAAIIFLIVLNSVIIPNSRYNSAVKLMDEGKYEEAISAFEAMEGYKDSAEQIEACETAIMDEKYNDAILLLDAGNIVEAYESLVALDGYKDSAEKADSIYDKYKTEKLKNPKVGDYVFFGSYEQDNNTSNGREDIEWLVLEKKDNKVLLISRYALDCKKYNTSKTDVTWETCSLRKWLNGEFVNAAFTDDEKAMIPTVTVSADKNPEYSTNPGNATQDKVFLLSITEANNYFKSDENRKCLPTQYAIAQGAYTSSDYTKDGKPTCWWWLRSPGNTQRTAASVSIGGGVDEYGHRVSSSSGAIRPALWINLDS